MPIANIEKLPVYTLAAMVRSDWRNPYFGAIPYLEAMASMRRFDEPFGDDDGKSIGIYFLSNATTWRGEVARQIKGEIKRRLGVR